MVAHCDRCRRAAPGQNVPPSWATVRAVVGAELLTYHLCPACWSQARSALMPRPEPGPGPDPSTHVCVSVSAAGLAAGWSAAIRVETPAGALSSGVPIVEARWCDRYPLSNGAILLQREGSVRLWVPTAVALSIVEDEASSSPALP